MKIKVHKNEYCIKYKTDMFSQISAIHNATVDQIIILMQCYELQVLIAGHWSKLKGVNVYELEVE